MHTKDAHLFEPKRIRVLYADVYSQLTPHLHDFSDALMPVFELFLWSFDMLIVTH